MKATHLYLATLLSFNFFGTATGQEERPNTRLIEFVTAPFERIGDSRQSIYATFGVPKKVEFLKLSNRHVPEVTDTIYYLTYDGLAFEIYDAPLNREMLISFTTERDLPSLKLPIQIGASLQTVKSLLGKPYQEKDDLLDYEYAEDHDPSGFRVIFQFKDSRLFRITWTVFPD